MTSYNIPALQARQLKLLRHAKGSTINETITSILDPPGDINLELLRLSDTLERLPLSLNSCNLDKLGNLAVLWDTTRSEVLARLISSRFSQTKDALLAGYSRKLDSLRLLNELLHLRYMDLPLKAKTLQDLSSRRLELQEHIKYFKRLWEGVTGTSLQGGNTNELQ